MKNKFLDSTINFITKYDNYSEEQIEKMRYSLEGIYLSVYKIVIILLLSFFLGIFKEIILLLLLFNIIRYPAFGFHANTSIECLILSLLLILFLPFVLLKIKLCIIYKLVISLICIILLALYAPADTVKRPLPNKKKRVIRKSLSITVGLIYFLLILKFQSSYISNLLLSALIIESILILPITYKLFKQPYRNYKNYKK